MKKIGNSLYAEDWKTVAEKDWSRVKVMLREGDAEAAGYFLQQTLEKYLKTFLLQHGWKLKKIHTLHTLLDDALKYNQTLESFSELCERVSGYYFSDRYPQLIASGLTCEDIKKDMKEAQRFIKVMFGEPE